jgi:hypothetical protein
MENAFPDLSGQVEKPDFSVETTAGLFERRTGEVDDENAHVWWVEYWLNGELIRRSAHVYDKKGTLGHAEAAQVGG